MSEYRLTICVFCKSEVHQIATSSTSLFEWQCPKCGIVTNVISVYSKTKEVEDG